MEPESKEVLNDGDISKEHKTNMKEFPLAKSGTFRSSK